MSGQTQGRSRRPQRGRSPWALLLAAFVVLPLVEIYIIVQVGQAIGAAWTILLLVLDSIIGVALVRREGLRAWRDLQETLAAGRAPTTSLADGALLLIGATLMVTPGFVTDAMGLFLVLPFTRPLLRGALARRLAGRVQAGPGSAPFAGGFGVYGAGPGAAGRPGPTTRTPPGTGRPASGRGDGSVVEGVVVDSHDEPPAGPSRS